jgi:hypothetical protein
MCRYVVSAWVLWQPDVRELGRCGTAEASWVFISARELSSGWVGCTGRGIFRTHVQKNRISQPIEIEPCGEKSMYVLRNVVLSLKNFEKKYLHVHNRNTRGYAKFETEIHLFMTCTKKDKNTYSTQ